jgi:uroporphyrinogen decarboxylase
VGLENSPFLQACAGRIPSRTPVWILRQAGRYLPEYRAVRAKFPDFLTFIKTPEACAEVTLQPVDIIGVDAAILFSDILTVLPPLGFDLAFKEGEGPRLSNPLRRGDGRKLPTFDPVVELSYVHDAVRACRASLPSDTPLIGFAGAPWTVACYAVDGGGGKEFSKTRAWLHADPVGFSQVLDVLADVTADHLAAQAEAGCQALQIFESWGGIVAPADYRRVILPAVERLISRLREKTQAPVIFYCNGASTLMGVLSGLDANVMAIDWRMSLAVARTHVGPKTLQGNFDPCLLHAPEETIRNAVRLAHAQAAGGPWIANLGHGIQPDAPVAGLKALVDAVHALPPVVAEVEE